MQAAILAVLDSTTLAGLMEAEQAPFAPAGFVPLSSVAPTLHAETSKAALTHA